jgi:hypothetical protein
MPTKKMPKGKMMSGMKKAKPASKSTKMKAAGSMMNKGYKKM